MDKTQFMQRLDEVIDEEVKRIDALLGVGEMLGPKGLFGAPIDFLDLDDTISLGAFCSTPSTQRPTQEVIGILHKERILKEYDRITEGRDNDQQREKLLADAPLEVKASCRELASNQYFIGHRVPDNSPTSQGINLALRVYFGSNPDFIPSSDPIDSVMKDWDAATRFCYGKPTSSPNAFVKQGDEVIFRAAPDLLSYLFERRAEIKGLNLLHINDPNHVGDWLKQNQPSTSNRESRVSGETWLAVLTGYTPQDYRTIPNLTKRYEVVLK